MARPARRGIAFANLSHASVQDPITDSLGRESTSSMSSSLVQKWTEPAEAHAGEVRKLSTLLEASQALSATLDLKDALRRVLEILGRHHGAIRSTVVLLNDETGEVELEAAAGAVATGKRVRYRLGEGITGQVVATGKPIVVPRVSREPTFLHRAAERPELAD